jgi:glutamate/tyrosine decarboxylase-like PLP-dependent enzyme
MPPDVAYQIVHDELMLDGNARLNLATFVTTWMEPQAERLMAERLDKNMIDKDEYPQTAELEMRCVNILSRLWNAPAADTATGCSTTGSSEAAMLGGLALKRRWQLRRRAAGLPADRPTSSSASTSRSAGRSSRNLRLGLEGYRKVQGYAREVATRLAARIEELGPFALLTRGDELPVFAFTLDNRIDNFTVFDVSAALRERGWLVSAYTFPENRTDIAALRVVVKQGFSHDMADMLVDDLVRQRRGSSSSRTPFTRPRPPRASTTSERRFAVCRWLALRPFAPRAPARPVPVGAGA